MNVQVPAQKDHPDILVPPPLLAAVVLAVGLTLDWLYPVYVLTVLLTRPPRFAIGIALMVVGSAMAVAAEHQFRRVGTPVPPWKSTRALATGGIYRFVRNPIYVGMLIALAGLAMVLAADWLLVLLIPMAFVLHRGVVLREEWYLERKFGAAYRDYLARVPRYGWPG